MNNKIYFNFINKIGNIDLQTNRYIITNIGYVFDTNPINEDIKKYCLNYYKQYYFVSLTGKRYLFEINDIMKFYKPSFQMELSFVNLIMHKVSAKHANNIITICNKFVSRESLFPFNKVNEDYKMKSLKRKHEELPTSYKNIIHSISTNVVNDYLKSKQKNDFLQNQKLITSQSNKEINDVFVNQQFKYPFCVNQNKQIKIIKPIDNGENTTKIKFKIDKQLNENENENKTSSNISLIKKLRDEMFENNWNVLNKDDFKDEYYINEMPFKRSKNEPYRFELNNDNDEMPKNHYYNSIEEIKKDMDYFIKEIPDNDDNDLILQKLINKNENEFEPSKDFEYFDGEKNVKVVYNEKLQHLYNRLYLNVYKDLKTNKKCCVNKNHNTLHDNVSFHCFDYIDMIKEELTTEWINPKTNEIVNHKEMKIKL